MNRLDRMIKLLQEIKDADPDALMHLEPIGFRCHSGDKCRDIGSLIVSSGIFNEATVCEMPRGRYTVTGQ